jgi:hypothetical protein
MKRLWLVSLLACAAPVPAGFESGDMLLHLCQSNTSVCLAYLEGVVDGADALGWQGVETGLCVPDRVESAQLRGIYLEYAEGHRKLLKLPAGMLVLDALKQAWRCPP